MRLVIGAFEASPVSFTKSHTVNFVIAFLLKRFSRDRKVGTDEARVRSLPPAHRLNGSHPNMSDSESESSNAIDEYTCYRIMHAMARKQEAVLGQVDFYCLAYEGRNPIATYRRDIDYTDEEVPVIFRRELDKYDLDDFELLHECLAPHWSDSEKLTGEQAAENYERLLWLCGGDTKFAFYLMT